MIKYAQILSFLFWSIGLAACGPAQPGAEVSEPQSAGTTAPEPTPHTRLRTILIFGDSITAGFGLAEEQAFPALLQQKIDERGLPFTVVNAGLSGDTSAGGLRRIAWMLREPVDVFVLELGGNDGLRGTSPEVTKQNLQRIIDRVREQNPEARIVIAGMQIPPNLGYAHTRRFREIFSELAVENDALLIPFLLEGVGGVPSLNQPDGIHPTAEGHRIVAETVWNVLYPVLQEMAAADASCEDEPALAEAGCTADESL